MIAYFIFNGLNELICCLVLQQTRVSTVIPYFNNWISKWPTVQALAEASHDDVLSVWKGLGYYSRATRLHEGAKAVVTNSGSNICKVPSSVKALQEIPGIGRYTAGAVSSIAFGEAEPVLDGNVARVLSRQLGLYIDAKDKKSTDVLWDVADQLIKNVAGFPEKGSSVVPGQWNQALMELGSTICTPKPKCGECPIRATCRVYAEGESLARKKAVPTAIPDIEDACSLCHQLDTEDLATAPDDVSDDEDSAVEEKPTKRRKTAPKKQANTLSNYFTSITPSKPKTAPSDPENEDSAAPSTKNPQPTPSAKVIPYCALFPKKVPKKAVPEQDALVCIIEARRPNGKSEFLIEQRPAKGKFFLLFIQYIYTVHRPTYVGLLASLWQFPQSTLPDTKSDSATRKAAAQAFVAGLEIPGVHDARYVGEVGDVRHVFTHLKLRMWVQRFCVDVGHGDGKEKTVRGGEKEGKKWVERGRMDEETLSTGMRRCWGMVVGEGVE